MSLLAGIKARLLSEHMYRTGRVPAEALRGFLAAVESVQGNGTRVPDLATYYATAQTSTPATVNTGTGRAYGIQAKSPSGASLDVEVLLTDNSVNIASFKIKATKSGEVYFFCGSDGIGIPFATNLQVKSGTAADPTANPAAADRPDIVVIYGDDDTNTE